jgi:hypothetical protein
MANIGTAAIFTRKEIMRYTLFVLLLFLLQNVHAQTETAEFPQSWAGHWEGTLEIFSPKGKEQDVPMQLIIEAVDSVNYSWSIIYGADESKGLRPYLLKPVDAAYGRYQIDEQNTILLDAILIAGKLYSRFEVGGNLLLSTASLEGEILHYEIISGKLDPLTVSGGAPHEGEEIPEVKSYPIVVRQVAALRRR